MKMTLLDIVQNILSSMDSDEVNSIGDTTEARQVAEIVRTTYFNIIARANLPEHKELISLEPSLDNTMPVLMYIPENVRKLEWIKYNKSLTGAQGEEQYAYVTILPLQQFLDMVHQFNPDEDNVDYLTIDDFSFFYRNDKHPDYCTILSDHTIIFDSFNEAVDTTLQESKTLCHGEMVPSFTMEDTFIPDLDDKQFPLLLNEAKLLAFIELKQMTHEGAALESRRQWRNLQHGKHVQDVNAFDRLPNFGRRTSGVSFFRR